MHTQTRRIGTEVKIEGSEGVREVMIDNDLRELLLAPLSPSTNLSLIIYQLNRFEGYNLAVDNESKSELTKLR